VSNLTPEDEAKINSLRAQWDLLIQWGALIAMLPLEKWLEDFERAESVAPILDPTLYRDYLFQGTGEDLKAIIRASVPLKRAILEAQAKALKNSA
jgi:hypothetical protein